MKKIKVTTNGKSINEVADQLAEMANKNDVQITKASLVDGRCHYGYEIIGKVGNGDEIGRKGKALVHDDMVNVFAKLDVHLAVIHDAYRLAGIEIDQLGEEHETDEITSKFSCSGFKMNGAEENGSVILYGTMSVSIGGVFQLTTPKVHFDMNSYRWINELKEAVENARDEVRAYMDGKAAPVEEPNKDQLKMGFPEGGDDGDDDFNNGKED